MSQCRSCQAEILWARTENGKAMPMEEQPSEEGKFVCIGVHVDDRGRQTPVMSSNLQNPEREDERRWVCHWAKCPASDQHRGQSSPSKPVDLEKAKTTFRDAYQISKNARNYQDGVDSLIAAGWRPPA